MDKCTFCKIVKGDLSCYKVWEDNDHMAFLDINPIKDGHVMVIPKSHHPYIFEIDDDELVNLTRATKKVADILKKVFKPATGKVGVVVYGLDIDHTHVHLVPLDKSGDLSFSNKKKATNEQLSNIQGRILSEGKDL